MNKGLQLFKALNSEVIDITDKDLYLEISEHLVTSISNDIEIRYRFKLSNILELLDETGFKIVRKESE